MVTLALCLVQLSELFFPGSLLPGLFFSTANKSLGLLKYERCNDSNHKVDASF